MLIAFAGLPGAGKTTLAKAVAQQLSAVYLRIDTVEQALRASGVLSGDVGPAGYIVAYRLAESNLRLGRVVVADSVNPLTISRDAWRAAADAAGCRLVDVEVICSDTAEHRRRIETRTSDVAGLALPTWQDVIDREYEAWDRPRIVLDTAGRTVGETLESLRGHLPA